MFIYSKVSDLCVAPAFAKKGIEFYALFGFILEHGKTLSLEDSKLVRESVYHERFLPTASSRVDNSATAATRCKSASTSNSIASLVHDQGRTLDSTSGRHDALDCLETFGQLSQNPAVVSVDDITVGMEGVSVSSDGGLRQSASDCQTNKAGKAVIDSTSTSSSGSTTCWGEVNVVHDAVGVTIMHAGTEIDKHDMKHWDDVNQCLEIGHEEGVFQGDIRRNNRLSFRKTLNRDFLIDYDLSATVDNPIVLIQYGSSQHLHCPRIVKDLIEAQRVLNPLITVFPIRWCAKYDYTMFAEYMIGKHCSPTESGWNGPMFSNTAV